MVARLVGGGQQHSAAHATRQALLLGTLFAATVVVLVLVGGRTFVTAMGLKGEAARLVVRYIWIIAPAIPFIMIEQVGTACLRGAGDTYSGMLARIVLNLVDMTLSAGLVTGFGPLPNLGWDGLAIGSAVGHSIGGAIIFCAPRARRWRRLDRRSGRRAAEPGGAMIGRRCGGCSASEFPAASTCSRS